MARIAGIDLPKDKRVEIIVCSGADGPGRWAVPAAYAPVPPATASAAALMVATAAAMPI